jgi:class 3 adenylate cyclase
VQETTRTLVASVIFLDIVGYSKLGVTEQLALKQQFNAVLLSALESVDPSERIVVDTGDGAAITVLDNPERALFMAIGIFDNSGEIKVRAGVNLGPVSLLKDVNGQANVIGDGINVAQRVMGFAAEGELLVSRTFHEVVTLLSADYAAIFSHEGQRVDKHARTHEVYAVRQSVRVGRRMAELQSRQSSRRSPAAGGSADRKAFIVDAGAQILVSAYSEAAVQEALERLTKEGRRLTAPPAKIGSKWFASVDKSEAAGASVEQFGLTQMISGPTREAVETKVRELQDYGARLVREIDLVDGVWTAVCEKS